MVVYGDPVEERQNKVFNMDEIDALKKALSVNISPIQPEKSIVVIQTLFDLLRKLGLKSPPSWYHGFEGLEATLNMITFDDTKIVEWSKLGKKKKDSE